MTDNYYEIADLVLDHLTKSCTISYSCIRKYKCSRKIILDKIEEMVGYDFNVLLMWLEENKPIWNLMKYKSTRRFVYALNDYLENGEFTTDEYVYADTTYRSRLLNQMHSSLIEKYCSYKSYNSAYAVEIRRQIAPFLVYLQNSSVLLADLSYDNLYLYYLKESGLHVSEASFRLQLSTLSTFLKFCYENEYVNSSSLSFLMDNHVFGYFKILYEQKYSIEPAVRQLSHNCVITEGSILSSIRSFQALLSDEGYARKSTIRVEFAIRLYFVFSTYFHTGISHELIEYWADNILSAYTKGYKEYRRFLHLWYDFTYTGTVDFRHLYTKGIKYNKKTPDWAKPYTDRYIEYRTKLGLQKSTIDMDKNSIIRFLLFLDNRGISSFNDVSYADIINFHKEDSHTSLQGKNAYMIRVKSFLSFLYDEGIISFYYNSCIIEGYRYPHKVVEVIPEHELQTIYDSIDSFQTNIELRSICIFLLGVRMGIRSSDIVNLKFENISFERLEISFIQTKTLTEITLPMPLMVANSIYKYVKYARPKSESSYVFLRDKFPHFQYSRSVCRDSLKRVYKRVDLECPYDGFHITRKTYATNVLKNTHDISQTAASLGHTDNSTVDQYIILDDYNMRFCGLSLKDIPYGGPAL